MFTISAEAFTATVEIKKDKINQKIVLLKHVDCKYMPTKLSLMAICKR